ncbi:hypothetical protein DH2020_048922 [Rehmannia glutinosa]|uniref:Cation/H+ exchanger transmembrane domain-containing protein n=1 Tax=Rehmannia glutinosa TaxID=99300 RepID=A0ABR0U4U7_REHGL
MGIDSRTVFETMDMLSTSDHASVVAISLFVTLLCACIVIGHLLEENRWMNESITALLIGVGTGVVILLISKGKSSHLMVFSEDLFFIYLLPPIIFNAGKEGAFVLLSFNNIKVHYPVSALALFDFHGLNFTKKLQLEAIFAATDSVCTLQILSQDETPLLYSLVFGEGVVNDATSVVLFNAVKNFDLSHINTTVALELTGLLSAYVIKKLYFGRHSTDREVAIMMLMAYLSYMLAELFYLSGILTVFFCGIVMSHYTWHNVTENSRVTTKHTFATLSFVAEIFIFLYVGMDALDIDKWRVVSSSPKKSIYVSATLLGLTLVGRAAFVFPLSFLSNLTKKSPNEKIHFKQQITIWWAGLMRGAVSMALAYNQEAPDSLLVPMQFTKAGHTQDRGNAIMITSTITVVLFSTVVFGLLTKPLVRFLMPSPKQLHRSISSEPVTPNSMIVPLLGEGQDSVAELFSGNGIAREDGQTVARPSSLRMLL